MEIFLEQLESGDWVVSLDGKELPGDYATRQAAEYAVDIDVGILKELHELIVLVRGRPISLADLSEAIGDF